MSASKCVRNWSEKGDSKLERNAKIGPKISDDNNGAATTTTLCAAEITPPSTQQQQNNESNDRFEKESGKSDSMREGCSNRIMTAVPASPPKPKNPYKKDSPGRSSIQGSLYGTTNDVSNSISHACHGTTIRLSDLPDDAKKRRMELMERGSLQARQIMTAMNKAKPKRARKSLLSSSIGMDLPLVASPISALEMLQARHRRQTLQMQHQHNTETKFENSVKTTEGAAATVLQNKSDEARKGLTHQPRLFLFRRNHCKETKDYNKQNNWNDFNCHGMWELENGITEISGQGGSGKTQICLSLCVSCVLSPFTLPHSTLPISDCEHLSDTRNTSKNTLNGTSLLDSPSPSDDLPKNSPNIQFKNTSNYHKYRSYHHTAIYVSMGEGIRQSQIARRLHQMIVHRKKQDQTQNNYHTHSHHSKRTHYQQYHIHHRPQTIQQIPNSYGDSNEINQILSRIWLLKVKNEDEFMEFVEFHLPPLLQAGSILRGLNKEQQQQQHSHKKHHQKHQKQESQQEKQQQQLSLKRQHQLEMQQKSNTKVGIVIIDGIAGYFRFSDPLSQYGTHSKFHRDRSSKLFKISSLLRQYSYAWDVPIVVTNQVSSYNIDVCDIVDKGMCGVRKKDDSRTIVVPALGLTWSNCVNVRYIIQRRERERENNHLPSVKERVGNVCARATLDVTNDVKASRFSGNSNWESHGRRYARVLQSSNMPKEREVRFMIDTGGVVVV